MILPLSLIKTLAVISAVFLLIIGSSYIYNVFLLHPLPSIVYAASASAAPDNSSNSTGDFTSSDCLPAGHGDLLTQHVINTSDSTPPTVQAVLQQLQAQCVASGLVRPNGQRIQFYTLGGCEGWSTDKVKKFIDTQQPIVQNLAQERNYSILEIECNPHTLP